MVADWGAHPLARSTSHGWSASPAERLAVLLRARDVPIGLVTDGRWWAVVWAPLGGTTGVAVWDASLWGEEARLSADAEVEQVALEARRLVAEHCLYGVDINPLAVEMAKLSLWLVTMDRERPFGFLDDRLVAGDSLLGLASVEQLITLHAHPDGGPAELSYADGWEELLAQAADLRRRITAQPVPPDATWRSRPAWAQSRTLTEQLRAVADAVTGVGLARPSCQPRSPTPSSRLSPSPPGCAAPDYATRLADHIASVQDGRPDGVVPRTPLHWPIAFPEVFADAADRALTPIIGNPPFLEVQSLTGSLGIDYASWLQRWDGRGVRGSADLAARFILRAARTPLRSRAGGLHRH